LLAAGVLEGPPVALANLTATAEAENRGVFPRSIGRLLSVASNVSKIVFRRKAAPAVAPKELAFRF
jgi:hypothetical protein